MSQNERFERHLMRQRGAGVRTVSANFGFSLTAPPFLHAASDTILHVASKSALCAGTESAPVEAKPSEAVSMTPGPAKKGRKASAKTAPAPKQPRAKKADPFLEEDTGRNAAKTGISPTDTVDDSFIALVKGKKTTGKRKQDASVVGPLQKVPEVAFEGVTAPPPARARKTRKAALSAIAKMAEDLAEEAAPIDKKRRDADPETTVAGPLKRVETGAEVYLPEVVQAVTLPSPEEVPILPKARKRGARTAKVRPPKRSARQEPEAEHVEVVLREAENDRDTAQLAEELQAIQENDQIEAVEITRARRVRKRFQSAVVEDAASPVGLHATDPAFEVRQQAKRSASAADEIQSVARRRAALAIDTDSEKRIARSKEKREVKPRKATKERPKRNKQTKHDQNAEQDPAELASKTDFVPNGTRYPLAETNVNSIPRDSSPEKPTKSPTARRQPKRTRTATEDGAFRSPTKRRKIHVEPDIPTRPMDMMMHDQTHDVDSDDVATRSIVMQSKLLPRQAAESVDINNMYVQTHDEQMNIPKATDACCPEAPASKDQPAAVTLARADGVRIPTVVAILQQTREKDLGGEDVDWLCAPNGPRPGPVRAAPDPADLLAARRKGRYAEQDMDLDDLLSNIASMTKASTSASGVAEVNVMPAEQTARTKKGRRRLG